jgi:hypothetical protein
MILQGSRLSQQTSERMRRSRSATDAINLSRLAEEALEAAAQTNASIAIAESCTAGKLAALLSEAPGAATVCRAASSPIPKPTRPNRSGCPLISCSARARFAVRSPLRWQKERWSNLPHLGVGEDITRRPNHGHRCLITCSTDRFYRTANVTLRTSGP